MPLLGRRWGTVSSSDALDFPYAGWRSSHAGPLAVPAGLTWIHSMGSWVMLEAEPGPIILTFAAGVWSPRLG